MPTPLDAVTLDAAGTLLQLAEPVGTTYTRFAQDHGLVVVPGVEQRFRQAFAEPVVGLRYAGDGRPFWRRVVAAATGHEHAELFEDLYRHYGRPGAWRIATDAPDRVADLRAAGVRVGVLSNWDLRLRPLLDQLGVLHWVDDAIVSAEVGLEKPDPAIFHLACAHLGARPSHTVHLGDSRRDDLEGALGAGLHAHRWADLASALDGLLAIAGR